MAGFAKSAQYFASCAFRGLYTFLPAQTRMTLFQQRRIPMAIIKKQAFIDSIADALQFISYYHPEDFIKR